jgi:peptidoglycan/xylan/chitin deacetylase (PgdA/CDA1 family)
MYHRVTALGNDPFLLAVTPDHFGEHLDAIRRYGAPLRLQDLVRALRQGKVPSHAVVITFDDGYADNLHDAKPMLTQYDVPATVFVTAGQVGRDREFWWDELDRLLLQPGTLPSELRLRINGSLREWPLGEASTYSEEQYRRDRQWHVERPDTPGPRQQVFLALYDLLYPLPTAERWSVLDQMTAWAEASPVARATHRALTPNEAVRLADGALVEIGAHTMSHPVLAALPVEEQRREIRESKTHLEALLSGEVTSFAYPHGSTTPAATASLEDAGFVCACCSESEVIFRAGSRFHLPRLGVRDWDGDTFARWLRWWVGG